MLTLRTNEGIQRVETKQVLGLTLPLHKSFETMTPRMEAILRDMIMSSVRILNLNSDEENYRVRSSEQGYQWNLEFFCACTLDPVCKQTVTVDMLEPIDKKTRKPIPLVKADYEELTDYVGEAYTLLVNSLLPKKDDEPKEDDKGNAEVETTPQTEESS
jgi:hypothetical protein